MELCCPTCIAVVVAIIVTIYLYLRRPFSYWSKRGVPYVGGSLIVGSLKDAVLQRKHMGEVYVDMYRELDGYEYGGFFKFQVPSLMIRDPDLVRTILVKDFHSFHDNDIEISEDVDPLAGRNPFILTGERWKSVRSQLTPAFTSGKMKVMFPLMAEVARGMKAYLESDKPQDGYECKELTAKYTTDVVASCAFGIQGNSFKDPNAKFRVMGKKIMEPTFLNQIKIMIMIFSPWLTKLLRLKFISQEVGDFFRNILKEVMTHRKASKVTRNDFLQLLITLKEKGQLAPEDGESNPSKEPVNIGSYTDEDIAAHALTFFTDGFETSSIIFTFAILNLAMYPEVQERLRQEVSSVLQDHDGELSYDAVNNMPYLEMVLAETLRIWPPAGFLTRRCTKPYKLPLPSGGVYHIEVGTPVTLPLYALQRDPKIFPDPEHFNPERFNEANKKNIHRGAYFPFGDGPRSCLGMRLATAQIKAGLASLVFNFELTVNPKTRLPVKIDPRHFMFTVEGGCWIDFKPFHKE